MHSVGLSALWSLIYYTTVLLSSLHAVIINADILILSAVLRETSRVVFAVLYLSYTETCKYVDRNLLIMKYIDSAIMLFSTKQKFVQRARACHNKQFECAT